MSRVLTHATPRTAGDIAGDRVSIFTFGAVGDGVANDTNALKNGITDLVAVGGGELYIPGGFNFNIDPFDINNGSAPITLTGDGYGSLFTRRSVPAAGKGWFNVLAGSKNLRFRGIRWDAGVTSPVGVNYSNITGGDPMASILSTGTTFWFQGNNANIRFEDFWIMHTGGYAILLDARTGNIQTVRVDAGHFWDNRPNLFGTSNGDLNYGSWTGGIHWQNDGVSSFTNVTRLLIQHCEFLRNTGNCAWGHAYGFGALHENIKIDNNYFEDCGLDAIEHGNTLGGSMSYNRGRRIGYISLADGAVGTPKWLPNLNATFLDCSGIVRNVTCNGNEVISMNGGFGNGDGLCYSTVSNNTGRIPIPGEPEYVTDSIASFGPSSGGQNWSQGFTTNNSANQGSGGGIGVTLTGNHLRNFGGSNFALFCARNCKLIGNTMDLPNAPNQVPVLIGPISASANQRAFSNTISQNTFLYDPGIDAPCVYEDSSFAAFSAGEKNWISANTIITPGQHAYEFQPNAVTGSTTEVQFSSNIGGLTTPSSHLVRREGKGSASSSVLKFYIRDGATIVSHMQLQGYWTSGQIGPLLNVSAAGVGGVVTTAARTTSAFTDAMLTGKLYADAFLVLTDTTFANVDANLLGTAFALLRFRLSVGYIEQSISVSAGARVWAPLAPTVSGVAGLDKQLQYNKALAFGADSKLRWDYTAFVLYVNTTTDDGSGASLQLTGFASSTLGYYSAGISSTTVNIPNGGVTALSHISIRNDGDSGFILSRTSAVARDWGFNVGSNGHLILRDRTGGFSILDVTPTQQVTLGNQLVVVGVNNGQSILVQAGFVESAQGFLSDSTSFQGIQDPLGGVYARSVRALKYTQLGNNNGVPATTTGDVFDPTTAGAIFWNLAVSALQVWNGLAWITFNPGGVTSVSGLGGAITLVAVAQQTTIVPSGTNITIGTVQNIGTTSIPTFGGLTLGSAGAAAALQVFGAANSTAVFQVNQIGNGTTVLIDGLGNVSATGVFASNGANGGVNVTGQTAVNSIQTIGGVRVGTSGGGNGVYQIGVTTVIDSARNLVNITALTLSSNVNTTGGAYQINGTTVIDSARNASFLTVSASGISGTLTFRNTNGLYQVDGNGNVSAAGVLASTGASGGVNVTGQSATNSIQTIGGVRVGSSGSSNGVFQVGVNTVIDSNRNFIGVSFFQATVNSGTPGAMIDSFGNVIAWGGFFVNNGGVTFTGQTHTFSGSFTSMVFQKGILVGGS